MLVDKLLEAGYTDVISFWIFHQFHSLYQEGLRQAEQVTWIVSDITEFRLSAHDVWHDRAVFHFLTDLKTVKKLCQL